MSSNVVNQTPFLRTSREFPEDNHNLAVQTNKMYVDIASAVNNRTIGIFPINRPVVNGESWFITKNLRQQGFRQVYKITSYAAINHGLNFTSISTFTSIRGIGFDGTNYFPIPYIAGIIANGDVGIYVTPTQIILNPGAAAPTIVSGIIILEWISNP